MSYEQYYDIIYEQSLRVPSRQGSGRRRCAAWGLTVVDWTDLGNVMGYQMNRYGVRDHAQINTADVAAKAKVQARWPAVNGADIDIKF